MLALVFDLGTERFAVAARAVHEVVRRPPTRTVLGAPPWIEGLFAWGDAWLPLVDMAHLVTGEPCPDAASSRVAIVDRALAADVANGAERVRKRPMGLLAPGMTRVIDLGDAPTSAGLRMEGLDFLGPIVRSDRYGVQLIDVDRIVPPHLDAMLFEAGSEP